MKTYITHEIPVEAFLRAYNFGIREDWYGMVKINLESQYFDVSIVDFDKGDRCEDEYHFLYLNHTELSKILRALRDYPDDRSCTFHCRKSYSGIGQVFEIYLPADEEWIDFTDYSAW